MSHMIQFKKVKAGFLWAAKAYLYNAVPFDHEKEEIREIRDLDALRQYVKAPVDMAFDYGDPNGYWCRGDDMKLICSGLDAIAYIEQVYRIKDEDNVPVELIAPLTEDSSLPSITVIKRFTAGLRIVPVSAVEGNKFPFAGIPMEDAVTLLQLKQAFVKATGITDPHFAQDIVQGEASLHGVVATVGESLADTVFHTTMVFHLLSRYLTPDIPLPVYFVDDYLRGEQPDLKTFTEQFSYFAENVISYQKMTFGELQDEIRSIYLRLKSSLPEHLSYWDSKIENPLSFQELGNRVEKILNSQAEALNNEQKAILELKKAMDQKMGSSKKDDILPVTYGDILASGWLMPGKIHENPSPETLKRLATRIQTMRAEPEMRTNFSLDK